MLLKGPDPVRGRRYGYGGEGSTECSSSSDSALSMSDLRFPWMQPSEWGMGIFFVTPSLVWIFRARLSDQHIRSYWIAVSCMLLVTLTYYSPGWEQFGFRYSLDFLPFLLLMLSQSNGIRGRAFQLSVVASMSIQIWGIALMVHRPPMSFPSPLF